MDTGKLKKVIGYIEQAGITRYTIYCNNSYLIEVNSDSTKVIFDDKNEMLWYFRIPNMVQPRDFRPIAIECIEYSTVERICVQSTLENVKSVANSAGLILTDDVTQWLKTAASQMGLRPIQDRSSSNKKLAEQDNTYIPSIT